MSIDKKQLKAEYLDRPLDGGILLISFAGGKQRFLFPARDIKSSQNKLRFTLEMGNCTYKALQTVWDAYGANSLSFELIERYEPDNADADIADDLRVLLHLVAQEYPEVVVLEPVRI